MDNFTHFSPELCHRVFTSRPVWGWALGRGQKVIFVKNALLALHSCLSKAFDCSMIKGGSVTMFSDFLRFFASKIRRLLAQVSRTSDHDSSVSPANSFAAEKKSSKCRVPQSSLVAAIIFPPTKWLKNNHRLSWYCRFNVAYLEWPLESTDQQHQACHFRWRIWKRGLVFRKRRANQSQGPARWLAHAECSFLSNPVLCQHQPAGACKPRVQTTTWQFPSIDSICTRNFEELEKKRRKTKCYKIGNTFTVIFPGKGVGGDRLLKWRKNNVVYTSTC